MCEHCEWETAVKVTVEELIEKYEDALTCTDDWFERNTYTEILDDLKGLAN